MHRRPSITLSYFSQVRPFGFFLQMIKIHALEIISLRSAQMIQIYALEIISQITSVELGKEDSQTQIVPSTFCKNLGYRICSKRSSLLNLKKRQICHSSLNMHRIILSKKVQWNESSQDTSGGSSHSHKMNFSKILAMIGISFGFRGLPKTFIF